MREYIKTDENGYAVFNDLELPFNQRKLEKIYLDREDEVPENYILAYKDGGFYYPRWDGEKWVEHLTQEEIDELNKPTKEQEIAFLKSQLAETDYQIIKSSEYQLLGLEMPYDLEELHEERQTLRDKINELENL